MNARKGISERVMKDLGCGGVDSKRVVVKNWRLFKLFFLPKLLFLFF